MSASFKSGNRVKWVQPDGSGTVLGGVVKYVDEYIHIETAPYPRAYAIKPDEIERFQLVLTDDVIEVHTEAPEVLSLRGALFEVEGFCEVCGSPLRQDCNKRKPATLLN